LWVATLIQEIVLATNQFSSDDVFVLSVKYV